MRPYKYLSMMNKYMLLLFGILLFACAEDKTLLEQLMAEEAKVTSTENELLLGMRFGMDKQEFYSYCKKQNDAEIFMDGGRYNQVMFQYDEEFSQPVDFWFYQEFEDGVLSAQENKFKYRAWVPWKEDTDAELLFPEVIAHLSNTFGDDFITLHREDGELHAVDIDANRRIDVYTKQLDDAYVYMDVTDLRK